MKPFPRLIRGLATKRRATVALVGAAALAVLVPTSSAIQQVAPANTAAPTITGMPAQGQTLTATQGTWTGDPHRVHVPVGPMPVDRRGGGRVRLRGAPRRFDHRIRRVCWRHWIDDPRARHSNECRRLADGRVDAPLRSSPRRPVRRTLRRRASPAPPSSARPSRPTPAHGPAAASRSRISGRAAPETPASRSRPRRKTRTPSSPRTWAAPCGSGSPQPTRPARTP